MRPKATDQDFINCGFTSEARKYPLTERAVRALAHINRLTFEQYTKISPAVWYAPNQSIQKKTEERGEAHEKGRLFQDTRGRWSTNIFDP